MARLKWRRSVVAGAAIATLALVLAQPAMAYTELSTTGTVGVHSLTDTSGSPGAICIYKYQSGASLWQLKHIYVYPPNMKGVPGQGTEQVAWQFTVQRRIWSAFSSHPGPWENRYTSAKFYAYTDSSSNAILGVQDVKVFVPFASDGGADAVADYRVITKLLWYKTSGGVLGTATERVDWYNEYEELDTLVKHRMCPDYEV